MTTFSHLDPAARKARFGKGSPDPSTVYVVPELNTISVAFMQKPESLIANQLIPSVQVQQQQGKYASYPRGYFFRDDMQKRADGAESAGNGFEIDFSASYNADVWAYHTDAGPQMRANAKSVDVDRVCTQLATQKALIRREMFFFSNFFKTGVWTTQVQGKTSGGGGVAETDLSWKDANAKPIRQIKKAIRTAQELTGFRMNKATFSAELWDTFTEHANVVNRINAGQTPGGPAEITKEMAARWLGVEKVLIAEGIRAANKAKPNSPTDATANTLSFMDAEKDALLLSYTPSAPTTLEPSAFYFFDWVADGLVGSYGNAVSRWWIQERKSLRYEIEMATDPKLVSADCGVWMYDFLA